MPQVKQTITDGKVDVLGASGHVESDGTKLTKLYGALGYIEKAPGQAKDSPPNIPDNSDNPSSTMAAPHNSQSTQKCPYDNGDMHHVNTITQSQDLCPGG